MRNGDEPKELRELQRAIDRGDRIVALDGLTSTAAKAYVLSRLKASGKTIVVFGARPKMKTKPPLAAAAGRAGAMQNRRADDDDDDDLDDDED